MKLIFLALFTSFALVVAGFGFYKYGRALWFPSYIKIKGGQTVLSVVNEYSKEVESQLKPLFLNANVSYPPKNITLISFKDTNKLELWARDKNNHKLIKTYSVQAASGVLGPKLREGDRQVPEGIYKIEGLNPNSSYHLSMKLNYPNQFDLKWAKQEGREFPGTNIFIHGKAVSIGCLAMGDKAIEELFILSNLVHLPNIQVIISPSDPALRPLKNPDTNRLWVEELYSKIELAISDVRGWR